MLRHGIRHNIAESLVNGKRQECIDRRTLDVPRIPRHLSG